MDGTEGDGAKRENGVPAEDTAGGSAPFGCELAWQGDIPGRRDERHPGTISPDEP